MQLSRNGASKSWEPTDKEGSKSRSFLGLGNLASSRGSANIGPFPTGAPDCCYLGLPSCCLDLEVGVGPIRWCMLCYILCLYSYSFPSNDCILKFVYSVNILIPFLLMIVYWNSVKSPSVKDLIEVVYLCVVILPANPTNLKTKSRLSAKHGACLNIWSSQADI